MKGSFRHLAAATFATGLLIGGLLAPSITNAADYVLKFGHVSAPSPEADDHLMAVFVKSYVESRSQGRIKVEIYPSGQLGNFREMLEQVRANTLELTSTTVDGIAGFMPEIQVTDLPYILRDDFVAEKLMESKFWTDVQKEVLKRTGNIRLVAVGNTGSWRNFATTKRMVKTAADLKGLKLRTIASDLQIQFVKELGASATPIPWNELYTALATGIVDGTKNSIGDYIPMGMAEPLKHIILDGHTYIFGFAWMSDAWLKKLPPDLRNVVIDAVQLSVGVQTNFNKSYQSLASQKWLDMGNTIYVPNETERATFLVARERMQEWYANKYGKVWLGKWLQAIAEAEAAVDTARKQALAD
ncbi:TRAP transporter substrate-binding protein DctP [Xanthobacteraceae bacterium Astr-EGSB]|uniref:TRAP transporter substrate-binding protein DctP n=1 Tax=Astrobacterium formosum TaxID=3069710 RepID=UPI0027B2929C|nr:TRAP transporter substrate-binding protein DctP [Xanthobacteraceae bacterium Astr-EGSB]